MDNEKVRQMEVENAYNVQQPDTSATPEYSSQLTTGPDLDWGDTTDDIADMKRLGKKQEFKVRISLRRSLFKSVDLPNREISTFWPHWASSRFLWQLGNLSWCMLQAVALLKRRLSL